MKKLFIFLLLASGIVFGCIIQSAKTFKIKSHKEFDGITKATKSGKSKSIS